MAVKKSDLVKNITESTQKIKSFIKYPEAFIDPMKASVFIQSHYFIFDTERSSILN